MTDVDAMAKQIERVSRLHGCSATDMQKAIATVLRERDAEWKGKLAEAEQLTAVLREQVDSLIDEAANVAECDANVSDAMSALDVELRDAPKGWRREKILELVNVIVMATRGHEALKKQLDEAEAQAAAMCEQVQFAADRLRMDAELTVIYDKVECRKMADEAEATLSTTAGRDLLAEVERLRGEVERLESRISDYENSGRV